jgi:predicted glycosyltransferase
MNKTTKRSKIWIDLDNSPHVPFFIPIVLELEARGHTVFLTTRDCFQVCSLADYFKLQHKTVGRHYGANKIAKVLGTIYRSFQLAPFVISERPDLSVSHGSRSLVILSSILRIPNILLFDYEHAKILPFFRADLGIAPEAITSPELARSFKKGIKGFSGLKEDVYVASFKPDHSIRKSLNIGADDILVAIRPPATEAHYHNPESDALFAAVVDYLGNMPGTRMVILPRNEDTQREFIRRTWAEWCETGKIIVPEKVLNGLDLIWESDLVISGGGTMNREAAALGVPVYSIFRGKLGAVDRYLAENGRLVLIATPEEIRTKIQVTKRTKELDGVGPRRALGEIVNSIEEILEQR